MTRPRMLGSNAGISNAQLDSEMLNVIPVGACNVRVRAKALTIESVNALIDYNRTHELAEQLESAVDQGNEKKVNRIEN